MGQARNVYGECEAEIEISDHIFIQKHFLVLHILLELGCRKIGVIYSLPATQKKIEVNTQSSNTKRGLWMRKRKGSVLISQKLTAHKQ